MKELTLDEVKALKIGDEFTLECFYGGGWMTGKSKVDEDGNVKCHHGSLPLAWYFDEFHWFKFKK